MSGWKVVCNQCAVWRPVEQVTFGNDHDALMHAVLVHPNRVVAELTKPESDFNVLGLCLDVFYDRCAEEKKP
jgi:hypothetical protein